MRIPKKGALRDCNNWRGITLLSVPSKILAKRIVRGSLKQWICSSNKNKQVLEREEDVQTRSSLCATSLNSALNGRDSCTSTMWILRRLLIAFTENVYGAYSEHMEFYSRSSLSSRASITTLSVEWKTVNPVLM